MKCTFGRCPQVFHSKYAIWRESDAKAARAEGWFLYDKNAPVWFEGHEIQGMALCPEHRATERGKRLEALHDAAIKSAGKAVSP